jgi:uncharacterized protein YxjI
MLSRTDDSTLCGVMELIPFLKLYFPYVTNLADGRMLLAQISKKYGQLEVRSTMTLTLTVAQNLTLTLTLA